MFSVRFHVRLEGDGLDEAAAAYFALVGLFAGVDHNVMFEGFRLAKGTLAVRAGVLFDSAVHDPDVAAHVPDVREDLSANVTRELLLTRVIIHVHLQFVPRGLFHAAVRTHVVFDSLMTHRMFLQFVCRWKLLIADRTLERHVSGVNITVFLKRPRRGERFATLITHGPFLLRNHIVRVMLLLVLLHGLLRRVDQFAARIVARVLDLVLRVLLINVQL